MVDTTEQKTDSQGNPVLRQMELHRFMFRKKRPFIPEK